VQIRGIAIPDFMYGTAWKESRTRTLTELALREGFRAIDTANQRKHYFEEAVGEGIRASGLALDTLFIQTKYTQRSGQDERLPYDEDAPITKQVRQSFESSIQHLGKIDSFVLHGPSQREGLGPNDHEAWRAIEQLPVALIGISNVTARQIEDLVSFAVVPPAFVQNRCYASAGWDREVRAVCARHGITYQGFSILTANRDVVQHDRDIRAMAKARGIETSQLVFSFMCARGALPLTGTSDAAHMRLDLASTAIELTADELAFVESCAG